MLKVEIQFKVVVSDKGGYAILLNMA